MKLVSKLIFLFILALAHSGYAYTYFNVDQNDFDSIMNYVEKNPGAADIESYLERADELMFEEILF